MAFPGMTVTGPMPQLPGPSHRQPPLLTTRPPVQVLRTSMERYPLLTNTPVP